MATQLREVEFETRTIGPLWLNWSPNRGSATREPCTTCLAGPNDVPFPRCIPRASGRDK